MIEMLGILGAALAVTGVWLNNHRRRVCFCLFWASNALALTVHLLVGVYSLAARDAIFLALAVHGWRCWGRKKETR